MFRSDRRSHGRSQLTFEDHRRVGADEDSNSAGTTCRASSALGVDGDVTSNNDSVATIPRAGLDPVDGVEERGGRAVARVFRVDTLDVVVAGLSEEVHESRLDRLGLVDDGLSANVDTTDRLRVDIVLLQQTSDS